MRTIPRNTSHSFVNAVVAVYRLMEDHFEENTHFTMAVVWTDDGERAVVNGVGHDVPLSGQYVAWRVVPESPEAGGADNLGRTSDTAQGRCVSAQCAGCRVQCAGCRVQGAVYRVQCAVCSVQ